MQYFIASIYIILTIFFGLLVLSAGNNITNKKDDDKYIEILKKSDSSLSYDYCLKTVRQSKWIMLFLLSLVLLFFGSKALDMIMIIMSK